MVDTGITRKRIKPLSGSNVSIALIVSIVASAIGADYYLHLGSSQTLLFPLLVSFISVAFLGSLVIPVLQELKAGQVIREDGPQAHLKKTGTPTMGGVFVVPVGIAVAMLSTNLNADVTAACLLTLAFALVGWLDDWQILKYKSNKGISPLTKLGLQSIAGIVFCVWLGLTHETVSVALPLQLTLPLGVLFWPLAMFVLLGSSNATNLTDGLDGLAGGTGAIALTGLSFLIGAEHPELSAFCASMGGSYLGFLWYNRNPAKVFMGDTGSLALGGALASAALLSNMLWGLAIVGSVFIWESISVIAQVTYFKATKDGAGVGRRLFKMAPYHHHLELNGWSETQVTSIFYIAGLLAVVVAIAVKFIP